MVSTLVKSDSVVIVVESSDSVDDSEVLPGSISVVGDTSEVESEEERASSEVVVSA